MANIKKIGTVFGMLVSLALLIHGCGGGGGGSSSTPNASTTTKSAATASKSVFNALGQFTSAQGVSGALSSNKPVLKTASNLSDEARVRQALQDFMSSQNRNVLFLPK